MTTFAHPGVYIQEFTPGSPIEGVGTSTAAFIGTAAKGPLDTPTRINSWDEFKDTFGPYVHERQRSYLALSVEGFFANGGTYCFIVRVGTEVHAFANLPTINAPNAPLLVVRDRGRATSPPTEVVVTLTSQLTDDLAAAGGGLGAGLIVARGSRTISTVSTNRRTVTLTAANTPFAAGDQVLFAHPGPPAAITFATEIAALEGQDRLVLARAIPATLDFTAGGLGTVRIADVGAGRRGFRLTVPDGVRLAHALPPGSSIKIAGGTPAEEYAVVATTGTDSITLEAPLTKPHVLTANVEVRSLEFDLEVRDATGPAETYSYSSMNPKHPGYWGAIDSELVSIEEPAAAPAVTGDPRPRGGIYALDGAQPDDRATAWANLQTTPKPTLALLEPFDDIAVVAIPGAFETLVHRAVVEHCELLYDRVAILDSKPGDSPGEAVTRAQGATGRDLGFGAIYYPWIQVMNPESRKIELWPPAGHLAGIYAGTDARRGVHKAPANVTINGALGLERRLTDAQQDTINLKGVNALRILPGSTTPRVWGARTTTTADRNWQYINIRRLFLFLEESIQEGIQWAVFEPNDLALWQKLRRTITEFLTRVWRDGALFGAKPSDAFYVRIDEALNPQSTRRLGRLYLEIGVVPVEPAEFIVVRIGIWDRGSEVTES